MAGHAEILSATGDVFAHIHPSGSVAMPALALAQGGADVAMGDMAGMPMRGMTMPDAPLPSAVAFPYGFPKPGEYRVFVQVKHAGRVLTGAFAAIVAPAE